MSENTKVVQMAVINPGEVAPDGDFTFIMGPRYNSSRVVQYALMPSDAEQLHRALGAFLKEARKAQ